MAGMKFTVKDVSVLVAHLPEVDRAIMLPDVVRAYENVQGVGEVIVEWGGTAGANYNRAAARAKGSVIFMATDDQAPQTGAIQAALDTLDVDAKVIPVNRVFRKDGEPENANYDLLGPGVSLDWTRAPFITMETFLEVGPLEDTTWYMDLDYSDRLQLAGYRLVSCPGFCLTHLEGSRAWQEDGAADREYRRYRERAALRRSKPA